MRVPLGPGRWQDAVRWLEREQPTGDEAETIDRLFLLRYHEDRLYLPRDTGITAALGQDQQSGVWHLMRADSPFDAFGHLRQLLAGVTGHSPGGHCGGGPVETIGTGSWQLAMDLAAATGADVAPRRVPDARSAMSRISRWSEITGNGQWSIPVT